MVVNSYHREISSRFSHPYTGKRLRNPNLITTMKGMHKAEAKKPFWKASKKRTAEKRFPFPLSLHQNYSNTEAVLGPGGGIGIGCGVGVGLGLVGGIGYGGWPWNHLNLVFGLGMGCGIGLGFGYGQGIGLGFGLSDLESSFHSKKKSDRKWVIIQKI